jgi:hypothetical protein
MMPLVLTLVLVNLALTTSILFALAWPRLKTVMAKYRWKSSLTPIKHKPIESPDVPLVVRLGGPTGPDGQRATASYYRRKGHPDDVPFVATHYPLPDERAGIESPDTYVDDEGVKTIGRIFRLAFEPAEVAKVVGEIALSRTQGQARQLVTAQAKSSRTTLKPTKSGEMIRGVPAK